MALYHEAVEVLDSARLNGGSIKSIVFGKKDWKSDSKTLFALTTETAKWSEILSEVISKSGVLNIEKQLRPQLALVLTHDLLLAKRGIALPQKHGLAVMIGKRKARLSAELSKVRIRRGFASLEALKSHINSNAGNTFRDGDLPKYNHPRWIRINTARTTLAEQLTSTFAAYKQVDSLKDIIHGDPLAKVFYIDDHIPNLLAIPANVDITSSSEYKQGKLILQEKASCFPAYLLDIDAAPGDIIDACAAPGNKTTHLAALLSDSAQSAPSVGSRKRKIFACERDIERSKTLNKMIKLAGVEGTVQVKARQDFLKLDPRSVEFENMTAILLDPSCSGSGIVGRDEAVLNLHLPIAEQAEVQKSKGKKRKRQEPEVQTEQKVVRVLTDQSIANGEDEETIEVATDDSKLATRLASLSAFQLRLLKHAMSFPAAQRITYSTCSLHDEENEHVVTKAVLSDIAVAQGWRVLRRDEQVEGLRKWPRRGNPNAVTSAFTSGSQGNGELSELAEACIRCDKGGEQGTMGFFVAAFVRDPGDVNGGTAAHLTVVAPDRAEVTEDEWEGFDDEA